MDNTLVGTLVDFRMKGYSPVLIARLTGESISYVTTKLRIYKKHNRIVYPSISVTKRETLDVGEQVTATYFLPGDYPIIISGIIKKVNGSSYQIKPDSESKEKLKEARFEYFDTDVICKVVYTEKTSKRKSDFKP